MLILNAKRHYERNHPQVEELRAKDGFRMYLAVGELPFYPVYENMTDIILKKGEVDVIMSTKFTIAVN